MFQGKTKAALRLLSEQCKGSVLHLEDPIETENGQRKVRDILFDKHPPGQPVHQDAIIDDDPPDIHPVILDSVMIRSAALRTSGAAGPSGPSIAPLMASRLIAKILVFVPLNW